MNKGYLFFIYRCLNINVMTLVSYATIETKFQKGQKLPNSTHTLTKTPC